MTAKTPSSSRFDDQMAADLREWRRHIEERGAKAPEVASLTLPEVDALLRIAAERDALRREACAMPDERLEVPGIFLFALPVDLGTRIDAAVEADERVIAWNEVSGHPFFRECFGAKTSLLEAMLAKLTASAFTADIPAEVRERAEEEPPMRAPGICAACGERIYYSRPSHAWVHAGAVPVDCVPRPRPAEAVALCVICGKPIRALEGSNALGLTYWEHAEVREGYPEHDPRPIA